MVKTIRKPDRKVVGALLEHELTLARFTRLPIKYDDGTSSILKKIRSAVVFGKVYPLLSEFYGRKGKDMYLSRLLSISTIVNIFKEAYLICASTYTER